MNERRDHAGAVSRSVAGSERQTTAFAAAMENKPQIVRRHIDTSNLKPTGIKPDYKPFTKVERCYHRDWMGNCDGVNGPGYGGTAK